MSLATIMLEQLAVAAQIIGAGRALEPAWRIATSEGEFLILSPFDPDIPEQSERAKQLISRFMVWKMATSFVLTAKTRLHGERTSSGDEALLTIGVSRHERLAVMQRIRHGDAVSLSDPIWLEPHHIDGDDFRMLPGSRTEVSAREDRKLQRVFGKNGELTAQRLG